MLSLSIILLPVDTSLTIQGWVTKVLYFFLMPGSMTL
jgi:hypothetical protein